MKNWNEGWKYSSASVLACAANLFFLLFSRPKTVCQNILHWTSKPTCLFLVKLHHTEENQSLRPTRAKDPNSVSALWCLETHYCPCYLVRRPLSHFGSALKEKKKSDNVTDLPTLLTGLLIEQIPYCAFRIYFFSFSTRIKPERGLSLSPLQSSFFLLLSGASKIQKSPAVV